MVHQPASGVSGQISDIEIQANEILRYREVLNSILALHSGKSAQQIAKDSDRDFFMTPEAAKEYGLVDEILTKPPVQEDDSKN